MRAGIYIGSFNPFTVGHLDIAEKAKKIFDDVYIVRANNENKKQIELPFPEKTLKGLGFKVSTLEKNELTTDFIQRIEDNRGGFYSAYGEYSSISIIRGLRNEVDFAYEENLVNVYRHLKPDISIVHIFGDSKWNFVSSSLLRNWGHLPKIQEFLVV